VPIKEILIANKAIEKVAEIVDKLGIGKKCLLVADRITKKIAGDKLKGLLENSGYLVNETLVEKADVKNVNSVCNAANNADFGIAVGGGTVIDVTKLATYRKGIPFVSFPTAPSHDGIASGIASIIERNRKVSKLAHPPIAIVVDKEIIAGAPPRMIAAGCGDLLAKCVSIKDWELGRYYRQEYYCQRSVELALVSFDGVVGYIRKRKDIRDLVEALINSGVAMIIAGSSRPCSGSEHLFSHYLDLYAKKPAMHGEQCGIGTILMAKYHEQYNPNWWKEPTYNWQYIRHLLNRIHAPTTLRQIGISEKLAIEALTHAQELRPERCTILHMQPMRSEEAENLLKETLVAQ
jgi:glycerol-1-phosphate dehydrogenase [NAD(P)+]